MPYQVSPLLQTNAVSYDVALEDDHNPEVVNVTFHCQDGHGVAVSFGYDEQDGVEVRTLQMKWEAVAKLRQHKTVFSASVKEVMVAKRYFDSGSGKVLAEVADIKVLFSDGTWLQLEPGWQVSDLIILTRSD